MMPDPPDGGKKPGRVRGALATLAIIAAAIGIYIFLSPDMKRETYILFTQIMPVIGL